jgi:AcrR family transcriptional regulator
MPSPTPDKIETKILETAIDLFAKKGYQDATLVEIMKEAKITKGVLYHYFSSKKQILATVLEEIWQQMADQMMDLAESNKLDPLEKIDSMIDNTINIFSKNPRMALVFFNISGRVPFQALPFSLPLYWESQTPPLPYQESGKHLFHGTDNA